MIPIAGWVAPFGYLRIKACSRLPVAFRSVLRPSSPPGAKASTECPYRAHSPHAQKPSMPHRDTSEFPHGASKHVTCSLFLQNASGRSRRFLLSQILKSLAGSEGQTTHRKTARTDAHQPIHTDKDHSPDASVQARTAVLEQTVRSLHSLAIGPLVTTHPIFQFLETSSGFWWRQTGSNRRPPACKAGALPAELCPQNQNAVHTARPVVGQGGLEPPTPRLSSVCSNQLSY